MVCQKGNVEQWIVESRGKEMNRTLCNEGNKGLLPVTRGATLQIIHTRFTLTKEYRHFSDDGEASTIF